MSRARAAIAKICTGELGMNAAEITRHIGVNTSAITKSLLTIGRLILALSLFLLKIFIAAINRKTSSSRR